jgi:hypothetical protein
VNDSYTERLLAGVDMTADVAAKAVERYSGRYGNELARNKHLGVVGRDLAEALKDDVQNLIVLLVGGNKNALEVVLERGNVPGMVKIALSSSWKLSEGDLVRMVGSADAGKWRGITVVSEETALKRQIGEEAVTSLVGEETPSHLSAALGIGSGAWLEARLRCPTRAQSLQAWCWLWALGEDGRQRSLLELTDAARRLALGG